jgi:hypothetical protein
MKGQTVPNNTLGSTVWSKLFNILPSTFLCKNNECFFNNCLFHFHVTTLTAKGGGITTVKTRVILRSDDERLAE